MGYRRLNDVTNGAEKVLGTITLGVGSAEAQCGSNIAMHVGDLVYAEQIQIIALVTAATLSPTGNGLIRCYIKDGLARLEPLLIDSPSSAATQTQAPIGLSPGTELLFGVSRHSWARSGPLFAKQLGIYMAGTSIGGTGTVTYQISYSLWGNL